MYKGNKMWAMMVAALSWGMPNVFSHTRTKRISSLTRKERIKRKKRNTTAYYSRRKNRLIKTA